ncbi:alpha/beta fold hydrolase [Pontibacter sp. SGAir0037]|uniref:alpha/beta fold hydrolase n=1 Tax=Pontibacter sp. SGAir0037 TaxID=2571030 RepID=UPI0010CD62EC|nr:alpha/beta hydrolase [Pontibacter sp. SGAir0037]QCR23545.1 alpha/beta hydrolase [Pontibacter sp. SGAir0037]
MPYVHHQKSKLYYQVIGRGSKILLAFHGYGQSSTYYRPMEQALGEEYTIYAFDLFFHGNSRLHKVHTPLTKEVLEEIIRQFLTSEHIAKFSVMGFSMGGKFALTLIEKFPERMQETFLIAPDGIQTSFWYNIATYPGWMQQLFKRTVVQPEPFFKLLRVLRKYKLVQKGLVRFARNQMDSTPKRLRVYRSWVGLRELSFDIRHIVYLLNTYNIPVAMFLGEYDQVIAAKRVGVFMKSLKNGKLYTLKTGHSHLLQEVAHMLHQQKQAMP